MTALVAVACLLYGQTTDFKFVPAGMGAKGGYRPISVPLSNDRPEGFTLPEVTDARYGVLTLGPEGRWRVLVVLERAADQALKLMVDCNLDGDPTNDARSIEWVQVEERGKRGAVYTSYEGSARLALPGFPAPLRFGILLHDPNDPRRSSLGESLVVYADYGWEGKIALGGETFPAILIDQGATADFRVEAGARMLLDLQRRGLYDVALPANVDGSSYGVQAIRENGAVVDIGPAEEPLPALVLTPDLSVGRPAPSFRATTMDGQAVNFPEDFRGKVVLLDFWATWCAPSRTAASELASAYEKYRERGFEVLGVSLDRAGRMTTVRSFCERFGTTWPQIYDGRFWDAAVARLYAIQILPQAYLVDGDTGTILASGRQIRGERLALSLERHLKNSAGPPSGPALQKR